jgi:hypothetical protein
MGIEIDPESKKSGPFDKGMKVTIKRVYMVMNIHSNEWEYE